MESFSQSFVNVTAETYPLDNCEVARVENPASTNRPTITFKRSYVYINMEVIKRAPEIVYVLFLVDREAKKLILRPCDKCEREAVRLRTLNEAAPKPRHINGIDFNLRLFKFMQWDINFRYRVSGTLINSNNEVLAIFDLNSFARFELPSASNSTPLQPSETYSEVGTEFGATVEEHIANTLVTRFSEDAEIPVEHQDNKVESPDIALPLEVTEE